VFNFTQVVEWSSADPTIADVNKIPGSKGIVEAKNYGTTTIMADDTVNHIQAIATVTVEDPDSIKIDPANPFMARGTSHWFHAIASFLSSSTTQDITLASHTTWTITDPAIAAIQHTPGYVTANAAGPAFIQATFVSYVSTFPTATKTQSTKLTVTDYAVEKIEVSASTYTISPGTTQPFIATGNYPESAATPTQTFTSSVIWSSSNTAVADIDDSTGLATAKTVTGTTIIKATDPITNKSGLATLEVQ
jgi:hypothetical protein